MNEIHLSYLITTKNKLSYLKPSIKKLIEQKGADEEIIIADATSTDGTKEFLESLKKSGDIDYFVSESDAGEAHGLNKLLLSAKGMLVTVITDDDVFHYPVIQAIKDFMLAHPGIDMMSANGGFKNQNIKAPVRSLVYENDYRKWLGNRKPFSFCGLGIFLRKSSVPLLGLWNTSFRRADAEFSLRTTSGKANIAWYTGYSFVNRKSVV